jgi:hypothetical protein
MSKTHNKSVNFIACEMVTNIEKKLDQSKGPVV